MSEFLPAEPTPAVGEIMETLMDRLRATANDVVPRFLRQMPTAYFQDNDREAQLAHLAALVATRTAGQPLEVTLQSEERAEWVFIHDHDYPGLLASLLERLPPGELRSANVHSAADGHVILDVFDLAPRTPFDPGAQGIESKVDAVLAAGAQLDPPADADALRAHLCRCAHDYVVNVSPGRIAFHYGLARRVEGTSGTAVEVERGPVTGHSTVTLAVGNAGPRKLLSRVSALLGRRHIDIRRAYVDQVVGPRGSIATLSFIVVDPDGQPIDPDSPFWRQVEAELRRLPWVDERVLALADAHPEADLRRAEVVVALCALAHQVLSHQNRYAFARGRLFDIAERHFAHTCAIADLFVHRTDPAGALDDAGMEVRAGEILRDVAASVDPEDARRLFETLLECVRATLLTNLHVPDRWGLAIRLDPALLQNTNRPDLPFGVFFVHAQGMDGFHVRFRDIARGGVRVVRTRGPEHHALESGRLYDECYGLASAQQLKNKDIPEGGSKGVILADPDAETARCVHAYADGLLDLTAPDPAVRACIVDRLGASELLYLGPDENITPALIEWIVERAAVRGYPMPNAFMSSKPGAGINHKEFGVTSEGVTVFLEVALRAIGIDPRAEPFTVKLTGGPDGDVAGNEIRILHREFGDNARIVGIADGSGVAEDPAGLDHEELLRLFAAEAPIAEFDRERLGPDGLVMSIEDAGGVQRRNTMYERVDADAFVPAGGRPQTVHAGNWRGMLRPDGNPSSRVVVEGANIFLTPEAREALEREAGVVIVKDSSANKCGVICSSFEIAASMALDGDTFLRIKPQFVEEVLVRLRELARMEAERLFEERALRRDITLPALSTRLSRAILKARDAVEAALDALPDSEIRTLVTAHLPDILVETAGDALWERVPARWLQRAATAHLATRIVYREGIDYLEPLSDGPLVERVKAWLLAEEEVVRLAGQVAASGIDGAERIADLLRRGGTRAALRRGI
jgi:glutamate dehydrogenase